MGYIKDICTIKNTIIKLCNSVAKLKAYTFVEDTYTVLLTDNVIEANGTFTITLPTAIDIAGYKFTIKNSGIGVITIEGDGTETIDGALTNVLASQYDKISLVSNGANWIII